MLVQAVQTRYGDGMGGVEMHHGRAALAPLVHDSVEERFLGWSVALDQPARLIEARQATGVEFAERRIGRRHQPASVGQPDRDVAGRAKG